MQGPSPPGRRGGTISAAALRRQAPRPAAARPPARPRGRRAQEAFSRATSEDVRLGALECMTSLYYSQGRYLSIGVNETAALATKYCLKWVLAPALLRTCRALV